MGAGKQIRWHANESATEKQMSCRRVRLKANLVFTLLKSFGTDTKGIFFPPYQLLAHGSNNSFSAAWVQPHLPEEKILIFVTDLLSFIFLVIHNIFLS